MLLLIPVCMLTLALSLVMSLFSVLVLSLVFMLLPGFYGDVVGCACVCIVVWC